jgi:CBS domain-containing protein
MLIKDALGARSKVVVIVRPDETVAAVAQHLRDKDRGLAVVCDAEHAPLGIVSVVDINRAVAEHRDRAPGMAARSIMNPDIVTCNTDDTVEQALDKMAAHGIRHLPVLEDGKMTAIVSLQDLLRARHEEAQISAEDMRRYFLGIGYH